MARLARFIASALIFIALTLLTQVGGFAYLIARALVVWRRPRRAVLATTALTVVVYGIATFAIVPPLAAQFGRVRIACANATLVGCVLNRTYVRPQLATLTEAANAEMTRAYPGSRVTVLDANFPFLDGFPLIPHLGHRDGKKVDLAFFYRDADTGTPIPIGSPSPIGYFHFQQPSPDAEPLPCHFVRGRWGFSWLQPERPAWVLDAARTRALVQWWAARPEVTRIFLEPHLAASLGVAGGKVRFQGCFAARHDDHFHVEIR